MSQRNSTNPVASHILVLCRAADRVWMEANSAYQRDERRPGDVPEYETEMGVLQQLAGPCRKEAAGLGIPFLEAERRIEELLLACQPLLTWTPPRYRWKPEPAPDQMASAKESDDLELGKMTAVCRNAVESVRRMADASPDGGLAALPPRRRHRELPPAELEELATEAGHAGHDDSTEQEVDDILVAAKAFQQQERVEQDKRDKAQAVQEAVDNALRQFNDDVSSIFNFFGPYQLRHEELHDEVAAKYLHAIFVSLAEACRVVRVIELDRLWNEIDRQSTLSHFKTDYTNPAEANLQFKMGCRLLDLGFADKLTYLVVERAWKTPPLRGSYNQAWMILSDLQKLKALNERMLLPNANSPDGFNPGSTHTGGSALKNLQASNNPFRDLLDFAKQVHAEESQRVGSLWGKVRELHEVWADRFLAQHARLSAIQKECLRFAEFQSWDFVDVENRLNRLAEPIQAMLQWQQKAPRLSLAEISRIEADGTGNDPASDYLSKCYQSLMDVWESVHALEIRADVAAEKAIKSKIASGSSVALAEPAEGGLPTEAESILEADQLNLAREEPPTPSPDTTPDAQPQERPPSAPTSEVKSGERTPDYPAPPMPKRREPSKDDFAIYRYSRITGATQQALANDPKLMELLGRCINQGSISRSLQKVRRWLIAGNELPDLAPPPCPASKPMDPATIELGRRLDHRSPRQRPKRDADD